MATNQVRRAARRQERGVRRAEAVLDAAEQVFAELGYDQTTTAAVASRAGISPGSLYQFFPNKQAIARALGVRFGEQLRALHEQALAPDSCPLRLAAFLDRIVDPIVAFNRDHPALMRLFGGTHVSPDLEGLLADLRSRLLERFDTGFAARLPDLDPDQRRRMVIVSLQVALAVLPLTLGPDSSQGDAFAMELKTALLARVLGDAVPRLRLSGALPSNEPRTTVDTVVDRASERLRLAHAEHSARAAASMATHDGRGSDTSAVSTVHGRANSLLDRRRTTHAHAA